MSRGAPSTWQSWRFARARRYDERNIRRYYREPALTIYGLAGKWEGRSHAEGIGTRALYGLSYWLALGRPRVVTRLGLVHEFEDGGVVVVSSLSASSPRVIEAIVADDLGELGNDDLPGSTSGAHARPGGRPDEVDWRDIEFLVDDARVVFRLRENDRAWSSYAEVGSCYIRIAGSGISYRGLAIARIADPIRYLSGAH